MLREAQGGKEKVWEGTMRKRRRKGGHDKEYAEKGAIEEASTNAYGFCDISNKKHIWSSIRTTRRKITC